MALAETAIEFGFGFGEFQNLGGVVCQVGGYVPHDILCTEDVTAHNEFNTSVADITEVAVVTTCTVTLGDREPEELVGHLLVIDIEVTGEASSPETPFDTYVEVGSCLPSRSRSS